jgi:LmbE family N-acetylglucosaminyl deacetylase
MPAEPLVDVPARALAVYAHPDDSEVAAAGTLAGWVDAGCELHLLVCTQGEKGTVDPDVDPAGLAAVRAEEMKAAAAVLGATSHENLGYPDGEFENDTDARRALVSHIRRCRPDVVLTSDPEAIVFGAGYVNHRDHRSVGMATLDAVAPAAARPLYFPDAGPAHQVGAICLTGTLAPDSWVDISATIDRKVTALACHRSQLGDDLALIDELVRERAAAVGAEHGVAYAEAFRVITFK